MRSVALAVAMSLASILLMQCGKKVVIPPPAYGYRAYGGPSHFKTIQDSTEVTACLLDPAADADPRYPSRSNPLICRERGSVTLSAAQIAELKAIFADPKTSPEDRDMACLPDYGVRFTFGNGADAIAINLCFHCGQLATYRNSEELGTGIFVQPGYGKLVTIVKSLFPEDPEIAKLEAHQG
ncbi:MAG: hypothetical protein QM755_24890 [Luteolibacter sp.]